MAGFWLKLGKKLRLIPNNVNHTFTDEDFDASQLARKENAVKKMQLDVMRERLEHLQAIQRQRQIQEQIELLEDEIYGDDEDGEPSPLSDNPDVMLLQLFERITSRQQKPADQTPPPSPSISLSDSQIKAFLDENIPKKYVPELKKLSPEKQLELLQTRFPSLDEQTARRAVGIFASSF